MNKKINVIELNSLDLFRNDLLADINPYTVEQKIKWYLNYFGGLNFQFGYDRPIIRARICSSGNGYNNINELYAPPPKITKVGRMNDAGKPMLYAAYNIGTAISEINAKEGDIIHIAEFELPKISTNGLRCLVIGEVFNSYHGISTVSDLFYNEVRSLLGILANDNIKNMLSFLYMDALSAELLNDINASKNNYLYSRTLSRLLLTKYPSIDGFIYPSAKIKGTSNIVLKTNTIQTKINVVSNIIIQINKIFPYGICDFKVLKQGKGHTKNGDIIW
ncbi:RES family NAD+ phosphorylase [Aeromonas caviae]|uniref:RES family NAD+ phosphorylase n=1 Tax=Aeromonas caviae TaxID=648 RepID=UPI00313F3322